jgi:hypothetical protein
LDHAAEARRILAERELERRHCKRDLTLLLDHMSMVDEKTGEVFRFHLNDPTPAGTGSAPTPGTCSTSTRSRCSTRRGSSASPGSAQAGSSAAR